MMVSSGPEKEAMIKKYKENRANIPCVHFSGKSDCPFKNECYYAHIKDDGTRFVYPVMLCG